MRRRSRWAGSVGAVCLAQGCTLIDYDPQVRATDAAGIERDARVASLDARLEDARRDGASGGRPDAADGDVDGRLVGDLDAAPACLNANQCGGCEVLGSSVGDACGACGVGRYACDGKEQLACTHDGPPRSPGNPVLIDDLEDDDGHTLDSYGLGGVWYMISDGTGGTLSPPSGTPPLPVDSGALGSAHAMHFSASGFTRWGAGLAVSLNGYDCAYDASRQTGIAFSLKGTGNVLVSVATTQTAPTSSHGSCTGVCNDAFAVQLAAPSSWSERKVAFASLQQAGWGTAATFDPSQLLYIQFSVLPNASLDLYVDNLGFY